MAEPKPDLASIEAALGARSRSGTHWEGCHLDSKHRDCLAWKLCTALREAEAEIGRLREALRYIAGEDVAGMDAHLRDRDVARAALAGQSKGEKGEQPWQADREE